MTLLFGTLTVAVAVGAVALVARALVAAGARNERVRVSVDDLAVGRFPEVCVKTGEPTRLHAQVEGSDGGFQGWWLLLLLLGPLGIVAVVLLWALGRRTNRVGGELPFSAAALENYNLAARMARAFATMALAGMALGVGALAIQKGTGAEFLGRVAIVMIVLGALASIAARVVAAWRWVDVDLDGSGRWAVLTGVHPEFAAAVRQQYRNERASTGPPVEA
ncbi:MAG: hypothetical protein M3179_13445 [Actinomycetota bacterium]|nr:hypothetical protein [Actinomycetota bacterium]